MAKTRTPPPIDLKPFPISTLDPGKPLPTSSSLVSAPQETIPAVIEPVTVPEVPTWKPNRNFKSESNFSRFRRAINVLEELSHFAEDVGLHGSVSVELLVNNGEIHTIRRQMGGTQK